MLRPRYRAQGILVLTVSVSQGLIINSRHGGSLLGAARSQSKMGRYLQAGTRPPQLEQQEAPAQGQGSGHRGCHIPHPGGRFPPQGGRSGGRSPLRPLRGEGPCPGGLSPAPATLAIAHRSKKGQAPANAPLLDEGRGNLPSSWASRGHVGLHAGRPSPPPSLSTSSRASYSPCPPKLSRGIGKAVLSSPACGTGSGVRVRCCLQQREM